MASKSTATDFFVGNIGGVWILIAALQHSEAPHPGQQGA